jgi:hypothetical protein
MITLMRALDQHVGGRAPIAGGRWARGDLEGLKVCLVGENIRRYPMSLTSLDCQVSKLVNSDTCPRLTTGGLPRAAQGPRTGGRNEIR